jgi:hypothetical protein
MPRGEVLIGGPAVTLGYYTTPNNTEDDKTLQSKNKEDYIAKDDKVFNNMLGGTAYSKKLNLKRDDPMIIDPMIRNSELQQGVKFYVSETQTHTVTSQIVCTTIDFCNTNVHVISR